MERRDEKNWHVAHRFMVSLQDWQGDLSIRTSCSLEMTKKGWAFVLARDDEKVVGIRARSGIAENLLQAIPLCCKIEL